jgi:enoyl-CoA hydratase/3-hydroxyacyl-CoA dehydrogenase
MEDVDRGAKVGLRWAKGPFELMNRVGLKEAHRMAAAYADVAGAGWSVPAFFSRQAEDGDGWDFSYVDLHMDNGVATITINRPEAMNALNETVVKQLGQAVAKAHAAEGVHTMVLDGAGKAFVAGADVKFFVDKIRADAIPDIEVFTAGGHVVLDTIEASPLTTVALTTGLALGGGLELALACDYRVGTRRSSFRFPETGIGIYPGLGGSQRPARIMGRPSARWAVLAGNMMDAGTAHALGILTHLVPISDVDATVASIAAAGKPEAKYPGQPNDAAHPVAVFAAAFYADEHVETLLAGNCPEGQDSEDKQVARQMKFLSRVSPVGLKMASDLIDATEETSLAAGLQLELDGLEAIFSTADALEGLSALIEGRRATYTGV